MCYKKLKVNFCYYYIYIFKNLNKSEKVKAKNFRQINFKFIISVKRYEFNAEPLHKPIMML